MTKLLLTTCILGLIGTTAHAATLNKRVLLQNDVLTVGDVFEGAQSHVDHVLGPAPRPGDVLMLDFKTLDRIARGFNIHWQDRTPLASAVVRLDPTLGREATSPDTGTLVRVPVLKVPLSRRDVIKASDIEMTEVSSKELRDNSALQASDVIGKSVLGLIKPGEVISQSDLIQPKVIKRGELVTITLNAGRISLTSKARAMEDARIGDIVRLRNESSDKIIQARVTGEREAIMDPQGNS